MARCAKCGSPLQGDEGRLREGALLCDDCYLKAVAPKVMPVHQNDSTEFLRRLKSSYTVHRQKYD